MKDTDRYQYYIYILTNYSNRVLYVGVTNNLICRINEHKEGKGSIFTSKYNVHKLVYYELTSDINSAIEREKQIKNYSRVNKLVLIRMFNSGFLDLYNTIIE